MNEMRSDFVIPEEHVRRLLAADTQFFANNPGRRYFLRPADPWEAAATKRSDPRYDELPRDKSVFVLLNIDPDGLMQRTVLVLPASIGNADVGEVVAEFLSLNCRRIVFGEQQPGERLH